MSKENNKKFAGRGFVYLMGNYPKQETIKSVTHCPTCGGECSIVVNEDKTHSYKSKK